MIEEHLGSYVSFNFHGCFVALVTSSALIPFRVRSSALRDLHCQVIWLEEEFSIFTWEDVQSSSKLTLCFLVDFLTSK